MSRHRLVISSEPINFDIEVDGELWRWYQTEITTESNPNFVNRFIRPLESTTNLEETA